MVEPPSKGVPAQSARARALLALTLSAGLLAACRDRTSAGQQGAPSASVSASSAPRGAPLRGPASFASIAGRDERAQAIFVEASRVMLHPRCTNCHPSGDSPSQGMDMHRHDPPVARGEHDQGVPGLECTSCHQDRNQDMARVPGAPKWHVAPIEMAWVGKTPATLCAQLKDPARNGGKTLEQIAEHAAHDELVAWGWAPGADREPAPGSQPEFGALVAAWVKDGAACPREETR